MKRKEPEFNTCHLPPIFLYPKLGCMVRYRTVDGEDVGIIVEISHLEADFDTKPASFSSEAKRPFPCKEWIGKAGMNQAWERRIKSYQSYSENVIALSQPYLPDSWVLVRLRVRQR